MTKEQCPGDDSETVSNAADVQRERREFLEKCGRFAAYTTPAVLLLLHFQKTEAGADLSR